MGLTACAACVFAARQASPAEWLAVWLAEAIVALGVGGWALVRKAAATNTPLLSRAGRLFAGSFAPAVVAGAILTPLLYRLGLSGYLPGMWLVLYGAAVTSGGAFSVRIVPITGVAFMSVGITALVLGPQWKDLMMGFGFGLIHVVSGFVIARRYGG